MKSPQLIKTFVLIMLFTFIFALVRFGAVSNIVLALAGVFVAALGLFWLFDIIDRAQLHRAQLRQKDIVYWRDEQRATRSLHTWEPPIITYETNQEYWRRPANSQREVL